MPSDAFDLILANATVFDGQRNPRFTADVAIRGDRIAAVGELAAASARQRIDLAGKAVAPGFIDAHTHDDLALMQQPDLPAKLSQGITTVVTGNCGVSIAPVDFKGRPPIAPMAGRPPCCCSLPRTIRWHARWRNGSTSPSGTAAARMPSTFLQNMAEPMPAPSTMIPRSARPAETSAATSFAKSG